MKMKQDDLLRMLLDAEDKPEKEIKMRRFGAFRVRALDDKDLSSIRERATFGNTFDMEKFKALIIEKGCIVPQWNHPELLAKYNAVDGSEVVEKRLLPGEKEVLSDKILNLSGYSQDEAKAVEELKN
jgi:hypothetical protein